MIFQQVETINTIIFAITTAVYIKVNIMIFKKIKSLSKGE